MTVVCVDEVFAFWGAAVDDGDVLLDDEVGSRTTKVLGIDWATTCDVKAKQAVEAHMSAAAIMLTDAPIIGMDGEFGVSPTFPRQSLGCWQRQTITSLRPELQRVGQHHFDGKPMTTCVEPVRKSKAGVEWGARRAALLERGEEHGVLAQVNVCGFVR